MSLKSFVEAFSALILLRSVVCRKDILSQAVYTFRDCWIELAADHVNIQLSFQYPILISSLGKVPFPLYTTKDANETYKLVPRCSAIILISSDWKLISFEMTHKILERYDHLSKDPNRKSKRERKDRLPWYDKQFKNENAYVVGIFNEKVNVDPSGGGSRLFSDIRIECHCSTIEIQQKGNDIYGIGIRRTIEYDSVVSYTQGIEFPSISTIQSSIFNTFSLHSESLTKTWIIVSTNYWIYFEDICISNSLSLKPSDLFKFSSLKARNIQLLFHLISFLSKGKYGKSHVIPLYRRDSQRFANFCRFGANVTELYTGWTRLYMRDTDTTYRGKGVQKYTSKTIIMLLSIFPDDINFLSCDGRHQSSEGSYSVFVTALDFRLRLSLLVYVLIFLLVGLLFSWKLDSNDSPWLIIYPILIEMPPQLTPKIKSSTAFAFILIPALFTGILVANGYRGTLASDLIAPFPWKGLENFNDVIEKNYSIFGELIISRLPRAYFYFACTKPELLTHRSILYVQLKKSYSYIKYEKLSTERLNLAGNFTRLLKFPQMKVINCSKGIDHDTITKLDKYIKIELKKCEKSVYAMRGDLVYFQISKMDDSEKPMYQGKPNKMKIFHQNDQSYSFALEEAELEGLYIRRNLDALVSGGFLSYWEYLTNWFSKRKYDERENRFQMDMAKPKPLTLSGKIGFVFVIFSVGISFASLTSLLELVFGFRAFESFCNKKVLGI